jgi:predicted metalloprotease with PDZ domain
VGLDGFMRAQYGEFGSPELRYTFEDIVRVASEVSGEDQSGFLARFVDGTEFLDAGPYFEAIGMQVVTFGDEFYLAFREDADGSQRAMARSILGL